MSSYEINRTMQSQESQESQESQGSLGSLGSQGAQSAQTGQDLQPHQSVAGYLPQLLRDRELLAEYPNVFTHLERLLDEEISRVRASLCHIDGMQKEPLLLPEPAGVSVSLIRKMYVPVKDHPDFNFVGRILGPRGMTTKYLEQHTGCKIMVRGKGSLKSKKMEATIRGKPNWKHLSDELHVLITVEDTENRAKIKMAHAVAEMQKLLEPKAEGLDELKKRQLKELALINGTYKDSRAQSSAIAACKEEKRQDLAAVSKKCALKPKPKSKPGKPEHSQNKAMAALDAALELSKSMTVPTTAASICAAHVDPADLENTAMGIIFAAYGDYTNYAALASYPDIIRQQRRLNNVDQIYRRAAIGDEAMPGLVGMN